MTEPDPPSTVIAAELALGLLEGSERTAALRRMLADRSFGEEVERWRERFADLHLDTIDVEPPADGFDRIDLALDGTDLIHASRSAARWRATALAASLVAAMLLGVLLARPGSPVVGVAPSTSPLLVASIKPVATFGQIVAAYDPATKRLSVANADLAGPGKSAELWVIADGGKPRSVGILSARDATKIRVRDEIAPLFKPQAQLAISIEPPGGSPTGQATGPVVAVGIIS